VVVSCDKNKPTGAYITGKIVNPLFDYVVITDHDQQRDTVILDNRGIFTLSLNNITGGLFSISYPSEYQSIYIEPGDSLNLRANTKAFDETMAFTGTHERENKFLIDLFSELEQSNMEILRIKEKSPKAFFKTVEDLKDERLKELRLAADDYQFDQHFTDLAGFIIKLNSYYKLEQYPLIHDENLYLSEDDVFPDNFYSHRDRVTMDNDKLLNNYVFRPYANALVSNIAYENVSRDTQQPVDLSGYQFNKERLKVIDKLFADGAIKNNLATAEIRNFIRARKNATDINRLVTDFLDISTDKATNSEVAQMAATYIDLDPGNRLPDFDLRDANNEVTNLEEEVNKLTVLYYWSKNEMEYALGIHNQVKDLQIKYPEIDFVGINIDTISFDQWQDVLMENDFRNSKEFQINDQSSIYRQLALRNSNRSMVVEKDLTIIDPNINLFYYKIETTLLGYINR
jgi:peroxiredoxin